jgi:hypothetical protein
MPSEHARSPADKQTLAALQQAPEPQDAYQIARRSRLSAMDAGRSLVQLARLGLVRTKDPLGTCNDLAARYRVT